MTTPAGDKSVMSIAEAVLIRLRYMLPLSRDIYKSNREMVLIPTLMVKSSLKIMRLFINSGEDVFPVLELSCFIIMESLTWHTSI